MSRMSYIFSARFSALLALLSVLSCCATTPTGSEFSETLPSTLQNYQQHARKKNSLLAMYTIDSHCSTPGLPLNPTFTASHQGISHQILGRLSNFHTNSLLFYEFKNQKHYILYI